jgi:hypothetical protein
MLEFFLWSNRLFVVDRRTEAVVKVSLFWVVHIKRLRAPKIVKIFLVGYIVLLVTSDSFFIALLGIVGLLLLECIFTH